MPYYFVISSILLTTVLALLQYTVIADQNALKAENELTTGNQSSA